MLLVLSADRSRIFRLTAMNFLRLNIDFKIYIETFNLKVAVVDHLLFPILQLHKINIKITFAWIPGHRGITLFILE